MFLSVSVIPQLLNLITGNQQKLDGKLPSTTQIGLAMPGGRHRAVAVGIATTAHQG